MVIYYILVVSVSIETSCAVTYNNVVKLRFKAVTGAVFGARRVFESVGDVVTDEVDGAAAEATAHYPSAGHSRLAGEIIQKIEFFATDFIITRQPVVGRIHIAPYSFVIAGYESVTDVENPFFLAYYKSGAAVVFGSTGRL